MEHSSVSVTDYNGKREDTGMRRITTFRWTTDRIYYSGPIRLLYYVKLNYVVLCCVLLCCAVLCCAVLCCVVLRCAALCCVVLCCVAFCCVVHLSMWTVNCTTYTVRTSQYTQVNTYSSPSTHLITLYYISTLHKCVATCFDKLYDLFRDKMTTTKVWKSKLQTSFRIRFIAHPHCYKTDSSAPPLQNARP